MSHIKGVVPKDDYRLEVHLDNGSSVMLDKNSIWIADNKGYKVSV